MASNRFLLPGWYVYGIEQDNILILLVLQARSAVEQKRTQTMWWAQHLNHPGTAMHACWGIVPADLHALLLLFKCRSGKNMTSSAAAIHLACQFPWSKDLSCDYIYWITTSGGEDVFRVPFQTTEGLMNSGYFREPIPPRCPLCVSVEVSEMHGQFVNHSSFTAFVWECWSCSELFIISTPRPLLWLIMTLALHPLPPD